MVKKMLSKYLRKIKCDQCLNFSACFSLWSCIWEQAAYQSQSDYRHMLCDGDVIRLLLQCLNWSLPVADKMQSELLGHCPSEDWGQSCLLAVASLAEAAAVPDACHGSFPKDSVHTQSCSQDRFHPSLVRVIWVRRSVLCQVSVVPASTTGWS